MNNGYGCGGGGWNGNTPADSSLYLIQAGSMPVGQNTGYPSNVNRYGTYGYYPYGSNPSSNNAYINDGSNWACDSPVRSALYPTEVELNAGFGSGYTDNATNQGPYANVDSRVSYGQSVNYNNGYVTGFKTYDEFETEEYIQMYFEEERVWKRLIKKTTEKQEAGIDGKAKIRTVIKSKGIPLSGPIFFINFTTLEPGERGTTLKKCIDNLITIYGQDIFFNELKGNYADFLQKTINSRNRIMHIKKKFNKPHFNSIENILYLIKYSFLYRRIFLELIGIPYDIYSDTLKEQIRIWEKWSDEKSS